MFYLTITATSVSGADLMVIDKIFVRFSVPASDFVRNPVGHTCGGVLQLPSTYSSYMDFSKELLNVLNSGIWVMDIV